MQILKNAAGATTAARAARPKPLHVPHGRAKPARTAPARMLVYARDFATLAERRAWVQSPAVDAAHDATFRNQRPPKAWPTLTVLEGDLRRAARSAGMEVHRSPAFFADGLCILSLRKWAEWSNAEPMTVAGEVQQDEENEGQYQPIFQEPDTHQPEGRIEPTVKYIAEQGVASESWLRPDDNSAWRYKFRTHKGTWKRPTFAGYEPREFPSNASGEISADLPETSMSSFEDRLIRRIDFEALRNRLGEETCNVLDLATSSMTMTEIGIELGLSPEYARKQGAKAKIKKELDILAKIIV